MKNILVRHFIFLVISLIACKAFALISFVPEKSRIYFSEDKRVVYIKWGQDNIQLITPDETDKVKFSPNEFSLTNYPQSGLYEINKRKLLKPHQSYLVNSRYFPLNDKSHFIVYNLAPNDFNESVLGIYNLEKEIKTFQLKNFCNRTKYMEPDNEIPGSWFDNISYFNWAKEFKVDNNKKVIFIKSCNILYAIDVISGSVSRGYLLPTLEEMKNDKILSFSVLMLLLSPAILFLRYYMSKKNKGTLKQKRNITRLAIIFLSAFPLVYVLPIIINEIVYIIIH